MSWCPQDATFCRSLCKASLAVNAFWSRVLRHRYFHNMCPYTDHPMSLSPTSNPLCFLVVTSGLKYQQLLMSYWLSGCLSFRSIKQHNTPLQVSPPDFLRKSCCRYTQVLLLTMLTGQLSQRQGVDTRKLTLLKSRRSRKKGTLVAHSGDVFWFWRSENEDHNSWTVLITDSFAHGCLNQLCLQYTGVAAPRLSYWLPNTQSSPNHPPN